MLLRSERGVTKWTWLVVLLILLLILMIWIDSRGVAPPVTANPECPHYQAELTLSAQITNVLEYHDCQRLIQPDGGNYGTLAGVFVRMNLDSIRIKTVNTTLRIDPIPSGERLAVLSPANPTVFVTTTTTATSESALRLAAIAIAEIRSYDSAYAPLGIQAGLNCLYVVRVQPPIGAYYYTGLMIPKGNDDSQCDDDAGAPAGGTWLAVHHTSRPAGGPPFLPVARWDWDAGSSTQIISMFCDNDWCDVGPGTSLAAPVTPITDPMEKATWEQKGRYDVQRLAVTNTAGRLAPSDVMATATPDPKLGTYTLADFTKFVPVAKTVLPGAMPIYKHKFNYDPGSVPVRSNQVSLCSGWRFHCLPLLQAITTMFSLRCWKSADAKIWWARIKSTGGTVEYRCVTRRPHPGAVVPAAARWRWKMKDEGLWIRCEAGCCEVEEK